MFPLILQPVSVGEFWFRSASSDVSGIAANLTGSLGGFARYDHGSSKLPAQIPLPSAFAANCSARYLPSLYWGQSSAWPLLTSMAATSTPSFVWQLPTKRPYL